jgi:MSHA biogenesis protein MshM
MMEDFPKNHNLILLGQPGLMSRMALKVNDDIKSRITFSTVMLKLTADDMNAFILDQMDQVGLGHNTFTDDALALIVRSSDGILRRAKNLCLGSMLEAVRQQKKIVSLDMVNTVLIQPHWRMEWDEEHGNL